MEQVEPAEMAAESRRRAYEGYGWIILAVSAIFGMVGALFVGVPSYHNISDPLFQGFYPILGAWGITWLGFSAFALILVLIPFRREEQWAWYTLWLLPLLWLSLFALAPDLPFYLLLAILSAAGLMLPYGRFFSGSERNPRVR
jgi:hypothetical protein